MRNRIIRIRSAIWLPVVALLLLLGGCVERDLEVRPTPVEDGYAEIALDWGRDEHPQTVRYLFYNEEGELAKKVTGVTDGFKGTLAVGKYRLVVHNEDIENVDYRGMDRHETAEVFALEAQPATYSLTKSNSPCIKQPGKVYGIGRYVEFEEIEITSNQTTTATVMPKLLTRQMKMLFEVNNIDVVKSITGALNGVSQGIYLASGYCNTSASFAMAFEANPTDGSTTNYSTEFTLFNLITTEDSPDQTNTVDITLTDGNDNKHTVHLDITQVIKDIMNENEGVIPVEIPIEIKIKTNSIGELTATVKPWDDTGTGSGDVDTKTYTPMSNNRKKIIREYK